MFGKSTTRTSVAANEEHHALSHSPSRTHKCLGTTTPLSPRPTATLPGYKRPYLPRGGAGGALGSGAGGVVPLGQAVYQPFRTGLKSPGGSSALGSRSDGQRPTDGRVRRLGPPGAPAAFEPAPRRRAIFDAPLSISRASERARFRGERVSKDCKALQL